MKIAIISDIHANAIALDAVLAEIEREGIDRIVCLGDVAGGGPHPREVLDRLRQLGCPVIRGNVDDWVLALRPYGTGDPSIRRPEDIDRWCAGQLQPADRDYMDTFEPVVELPLDGSAGLLCFHGSPRSNRDVILAGTPDEEIEEMLGERRADVMAGGHTHLQMLRVLGASLLFNPGSIGVPFGRSAKGKKRHPPRAEYAVLTAEGSRFRVELRRAPIDASAVVSAILKSGMPHAEWLAKRWRGSST
jgi:predicted phosphodiesterase